MVCPYIPIIISDVFFFQIGVFLAYLYDKLVLEVEGSNPINKYQDMYIFALNVNPISMKLLANIMQNDVLSV